jgi:hypothetical protein
MIDLPKPRYGAPCNGCGLCCKLELCHVAEVALGSAGAEQTLPCPMLIEDEGRYRCGMIAAEAMAVEIGAVEKPVIAESLGVGIGCTMPDEKVEAA